MTPNQLNKAEINFNYSEGYWWRKTTKPTKRLRAYESL